MATGLYAPQFQRAFANMTHPADFCEYYADASGRASLVTEVSDHVQFLDALRNGTYTCVLLAQDITFPSDYFEPEGDYWTAFGDGVCYRRSVPLCPSQAFMSVVLAPSRDRQRAVIGLPRLSPLGNDVGVLEAPAGGLSMAYVITAGLDIYNIVDFRLDAMLGAPQGGNPLSQNGQLTLLTRAFAFLHASLEDRPFFTYHDTNVFGDCGGQTLFAIPLLCTTMSDALTVANHCHINELGARLQDPTVVDYMIIAYNSSFPTGMFIQQEADGWWKRLYLDKQILFSAFSTTFRCCEPRCKSDEDCADPYCAGHSQIVYAAGCDSSKDLCETEDAHVFAYRNRHYYVMLEGTTHADAQAQCASSGRALASFDSAQDYQRVIYGVLASDVGLDIRKRVGDIQAHVDLMDLASNATQAMDGVMWVDGTWENSEWVNSRGTRSFFQWFSGNGSITENYISFQPTPTPPSLEILCVGLETIYVFNIVRNCTQLFPSLCMSESPAPSPPPVITAAAADSSSLMLYTLVGVALGVLVLLFVLLLFCRGRKRLLRGADDAPPRSGLVALDPWVMERKMTLSEAEASGLSFLDERSRDRSELSIKSSNETALLLQSVMTTVQRLVDNNHSCRLKKVADFNELSTLAMGASPKPSLGTEEWSVQLDGSAASKLTSSRRTATAAADEAVISNQRTRDITPGSTASVEKSVFSEGKSCGSYQCVSPLGEGTTSTCFVVRNVKTLELCVLKVPKSNATQYTVTEAYYTALLDHFNIIMHHETFIHDGQLIVAMELCALGNLQTLILAMRSRRQFFPEEVVASVLLDLASGLAWMHRNMLAHRDIKPENAFISSIGVVKIGDLGSSRLMIDTSTSFVGTPLYMAPEVLTQQPYSMEMDIWSLGSVMFELCTLEVPFRATTVDALKEKVLEGVPQIPEGRYPPALTKLIMEMFAVDPKQRPSAVKIVQAPCLKKYDRASLAAAVRSTSLQLLNACAKTSFKLTDSAQFDSGRYDAAAKGSRMGTSV